MDRITDGGHPGRKRPEREAYDTDRKLAMTSRSQSPARETDFRVDRRHHRERSRSRSPKREQRKNAGHARDVDDEHEHRSRHHHHRRHPHRDGGREEERYHESSPHRRHRHDEEHRRLSGSLSMRSSDPLRHHDRHRHGRPTRSPDKGTESHHRSSKDHGRSRHNHSATSHSHRHRKRYSSPPPAGDLPHSARSLSYSDFAAYKPLFDHYMGLHNQKRIEYLDADEVQDQWETFVRRWNAGELGSKWYEPEMILRVIRERSLEEARARVSATGEGSATVGTGLDDGVAECVVHTGVTEGMPKGELVTEESPEDDDEDDDYAPPLPPSTGPVGTTSSSSKPGPAIPSLEDLELRRALQVEAEEDRLASLRLARRADRSVQKERIEELAPKPDAGSHERKLEKRKATTDMMRQFTSAREGGDIAEVDDKELIGGGEGADEYRRMLANMQRKKTEREVRREEIARARNAERDERVREYKAKEEQTVEMLKELARQRFG